MYTLRVLSKPATTNETGMSPWCLILRGEQTALETNAIGVKVQENEMMRGAKNSWLTVSEDGGVFSLMANGCHWHQAQKCGPVEVALIFLTPPKTRGQEEFKKSKACELILSSR